MFTGIIEEVGTVAELKTGAAGGRVRIECATVLPKLHVASSIAVSGCCLTVVERDDKNFSCDLAPETIDRTGFRRLKPGAKLNLEPCLTLEKPLDGHIVQGHVDGTGTLVGLTEAGDENFWLDIDVPEDLTRYLVEKGSVAVEGISLTIAGIEATRMRIAIIPFTYRETNLYSLAEGDPVNLECDVLAKYVEKLTQERPGTLANKSDDSSLSIKKLQKEGF
jgi:riboflavin synthase